MFKRRYTFLGLLVVSLPLSQGAACANARDGASVIGPDAGRAQVPDASVVLQPDRPDAANKRRADASAADTTDDAGTPSEAQWPRCLVDLWATCRAAGSCRIQHEEADADGGTTTDTTCFESGVKHRNTRGGESPRTSRWLTFNFEVYAADGSICYTSTSQLDFSMALEAGKTTWTDARGEIVAVQDFTYYAREIRCVATGETIRCKQPCLNQSSATSECTPGACD